MKFSKLRLGVNSRDGKARFYPSEASMYGGQYHGDIGIDSTGKVARVTLIALRIHGQGRTHLFSRGSASFIHFLDQHFAHSHANP